MQKAIMIAGALLVLAACGFGPKQKPYRAGVVTPPPMFPAPPVVVKTKQKHTPHRDLLDDIHSVMGLDRDKEPGHVQ